MKYIKLFETHADYAAYFGGSDKMLPNVSYCEDNNEVHYNPWTDPRLIAEFKTGKLYTGSEKTLIYGGMECCDISVLECFSKIEVDGVEISLTDLDEYYGLYHLSEGEHTIRYTLSDPTEIAQNAFYECTSLTSITIPNSVTSIGDCAFCNCEYLTSVTIPDSVTSIGDEAFVACSCLTSVTIPDSVTSIGTSAFDTCNGLTSITIQATTPPTLGSGAFDYTNDCPIYVPAESVNVYKAATNWSTLASRIQAIP